MFSGGSLILCVIEAVTQGISQICKIVADLKPCFQLSQLRIKHLPKTAIGIIPIHGTWMFVEAKI